MHVARAMRTLIDVLNTEHGYARIYYDQDSYSYQLDAYRSPRVTDLFERMGGYPSAPDACEAARLQLLALHAPKRRRASGKHRAARVA